MMIAGGIIDGGVRTIEFLASNVLGEGPSDPGDTISVPAQVKAGDLLVLVDYVFNATVSLPAAVVPSGFTQVASSASARSRVITSYKLADNDDASSTVTGMTSTLTKHKILAAFRPNSPAKSITLSGVGTQNEDGNPAALVIPSSVGKAPFVVFGVYTSDGAVDPRVMDPAKDGEISSSPGIDLCWLAWKIFNAKDAPADVTIDMDDEGAPNIMHGFYIEMSK